MADAVLAVTAGLLDVAAEPLRLARDRLAQRNSQVGGFHRHAVALPEPVEQDGGVRLAHAPQHQLVGFGVALQPQRRVAGHQPAEVLGEGVLVGPGLGDDGHRVARLVGRDRTAGHTGRVGRARAGLGRGPGADGEDHRTAGDGTGPVLTQHARHGRGDPVVEMSRAGVGEGGLLLGHDIGAVTAARLV